MRSNSRDLTINVKEKFINNFNRTLSQHFTKIGQICSYEIQKKIVNLRWHLISKARMSTNSPWFFAKLEIWRVFCRKTLQIRNKGKIRQIEGNSALQTNFHKFFHLYSYVLSKTCIKQKFVNKRRSISFVSPYCRLIRSHVLLDWRRNFVLPKLSNFLVVFFMENSFLL